MHTHPMALAHVKGPSWPIPIILLQYLVLTLQEVHEPTIQGSKRPHASQKQSTLAVMPSKQEWEVMNYVLSVAN